MFEQQLSLDLNCALPTPHRVASRRPKLCVYCGEIATTKDHVVPRCLLEKPYPTDLLTVRSCEDCNHKFSLDEQYLLIVIAQISFEPHLMKKLDEGGIVDRTLERAPGLDERIIQSLHPESDGRVWLRPEGERIQKIIRKIAFGLYVVRYQRRVSIDMFSPVAVYGPEEEIPLQVVAASHYRPGTRRKGWVAVQKGAFAYLFARSWFPGDSQLYCLIDLHRTLLGVVACPDPRARTRSF